MRTPLVGRQLGRQLGKQLGRQLGRQLGSQLTEALALAVHEAVQKQHGRAANVARADPTSIQPIQPSNLGAKRSFELCILCLTRHRCED